MTARSERYGSWSAYGKAWASRAMLRSVLRTAMPRWSRPTDSGVQDDGYSILIGVPWQLWDLVQIPLLSLRRARRDRCRELILAVDATKGDIDRKYGPAAANELLERYRDLNPRVLFYNSWQRRVSRRIDWNWVDCWLTWAIGISEARTRWVLLHDFDATVCDAEFFERQFDVAVRTGPGAFVGIERDGDLPSPGGREILATVELMIDAAEIRRQFRPVELFNRVRRYEGRRMECDILRDVQLRMPADRAVLSPPESWQVVHPSQVVSQWRRLHVQGARDVFAPNGYSPLFIVPYFRHVGGDPGPMADLTRQMASGRRPLLVEGRPMDVSRLIHDSVAWIAEQIEQLDRYFTGAAASLEVAEYCRQIRRLAPERNVNHMPLTGDAKLHPAATAR